MFYTCSTPQFRPAEPQVWLEVTVLDGGVLDSKQVKTDILSINTFVNNVILVLSTVTYYEVLRIVRVL